MRMSSCVCQKLPQSVAIWAHVLSVHVSIWLVLFSTYHHVDLHPMPAKRRRDDASSASFVPRVVGGSRQRAARAEEERRSSLIPSSLISYVLELWSWGALSPQYVQIIISKMKEDLLAHSQGVLDVDEVNKVASIGAQGQSKKHWHDQLCNRHGNYSQHT